MVWGRVTDWTDSFCEIGLPLYGLLLRARALGSPQNVMDGIPRKVIQLISLKLDTSKKHPGVDIHLWFIRHPRAIVLEERLGHIFNPNLL